MATTKDTKFTKQTMYKGIFVCFVTFVVEICLPIWTPHYFASIRPNNRPSSLTP